jgi:hypothetical protein
MSDLATRLAIGKQTAAQSASTSLPSIVLKAKSSDDNSGNINRVTVQALVKE